MDQFTERFIDKFDLSFALLVVRLLQHIDFVDFAHQLEIELIFVGFRQRLSSILDQSLSRLQIVLLVRHLDRFDNFGVILAQRSQPELLLLFFGNLLLKLVDLFQKNQLFLICHPFSVVSQMSQTAINCRNNL